MYSGGVCTKWGEFIKSFVGPGSAEQPHLILLQMKLDYIPNILPQTGCPEKFAFRLQRGSKWAKSAIFSIFFGFSSTPAELFILEENLCLLKFRSHWEASFPRFGRSLRKFLAELLRKNRLKLSILQKKTNFYLLKHRSHWNASFPSFESSQRQFLAELLRKNRLKLLNLQKSTKPLEILT